MPTLTASTPAVLVRPLREGDCFAHLTSLLHRAYRRQVEQGLRPLAGRQDQSITRERARNSQCLLAELDSAIVGIILFEEREEADFPPHFLKPEVGHFSQFAVDPDVQGRGIGIALLNTVERCAREQGFTELALSMAEPDTSLLGFYDHRGYKLVGHWQWPYTNYRSIILSKPLLDAPR